MRKSIEVEGLGHGALPIPAASRKGPLIATGGIRGVDRVSGAMPSSVEEQVMLMFRNLITIIEAAGATASDIVKLTIWVARDDARPAINRQWCALFPDAASRPARHVIKRALGQGMLVQCEALAFVLGGSDDR